MCLFVDRIRSSHKKEDAMGHNKLYYNFSLPKLAATRENKQCGFRIGLTKISLCTYRRWVEA